MTGSSRFDFDFEIRFNIKEDKWEVIGVISKMVYISCDTRESALDWAALLRVNDETNSVVA